MSNFTYDFQENFGNEVVANDPSDQYSLLAKPEKEQTNVIKNKDPIVVEQNTTSYVPGEEHASYQPSDDQESSVDQEPVAAPGEEQASYQPSDDQESSVDQEPVAAPGEEQASFQSSDDQESSSVEESSDEEMDTDKMEDIAIEFVDNGKQMAQIGESVMNLGEERSVNKGKKMQQVGKKMEKTGMNILNFITGQNIEESSEELTSGNDLSTDDEDLQDAMQSTKSAIQSIKQVQEYLRKLTK